MIGIRCHLCRERFSWDILKGYPTHCLCCGQFIGIPEDAPELATPYISTPKKRGNADRIYRDMEAKSEHRAQMVAEQTGLSLAELSHMKMTNMKDNLREGDTAFSENIQNNPVQEAMNHAPANTVGFGADARTLAIQASAGTRQGAFPNAGSSYINNPVDGLRARHSRTYNAPISSMPGKGTRT